MQMKQTIGQDSTEAQSPLAVTLRKATPKAAGTRAGILGDWREGSNTKTTRRPAAKLRDGR
jgi:hypothetical protein